MQKPLKALVATTAILFAACTPGTSSNPSGATGSQTAETQAPPSTTPLNIFDSAYAPTTGTKGGQILIGDWQEANQFNPFYVGQVTEANVASATWASLVVATNDYKYLPDLAAEPATTTNGDVKVPGDGGDAMTVTWKLKPDLKWSDGQALTCDDFKFTWSWVMDPANTGLAGGTTGYDSMTGIDCPDPSTIVEHFKEVYESYLTIGTPLPKHYLSSIPMADQVKGKGFQPADMPNVPTSGAFKFQSVTSGQELRLVRNDNYKGFKSGVPAYLDTLIFKWYGDADAMIAGYKGGEFDIANDLNDADLPKIADQGDQVKQLDSLTYEFLRPNWNPDVCSTNTSVADRGKGCPVSDPQFRLALTYAVNKDDINTRVLGGLVTIANTNVAPDAYYFLDQPPATFDPEKAKSILDAAGWTVGADGIRAKGGLKAKIELCSTTRQARIDSLKLIAEQLKAVGIDSVVNNVNASDIFVELNDGTKDTACALSHSNFDLAEHAFGVSVDPIGNYQTYHSSQFEPKGGNDAQINDPDLDKALEAVKGTVDFVAVKHAMATFQQIYVQKVVEIPLYFRKEVETVSPKLGNFFANPTSAGPTWNAGEWYVKG